MTTAAPPEARTIDTGSYPVLVGCDLRQHFAAEIANLAPAHHYAVITDDIVGPLYAEELGSTLGASGRVSVHVVPAGEQHKTRQSWATLSDALVTAGCGRDTTVVALGGGVVGDLAGFVAATYMRGIPVVQCPTSLLAMIDASVGGKTGVDTAAGKNLIGAFHPPSAVLIDVGTIRTLPAEHRRAGLAEAIKHGIIADSAYLGSLEAMLPALLDADAAALVECVSRSVQIKAAVVAGDPREQGRRRILNFGHTLGHALEQVSGYTLLHGEAVAIGMVLESRMAERMDIAAPGVAAEVERVLRRAGLPVSIPTGFAPGEVLEMTRRDKKSRGGTVMYALPEQVGCMAGADDGWQIAVPDALVLEVLA